MAKITIKHNAKAAEVLYDLGSYLVFCRDYGYKFNEADLYNSKAYAYQQYTKFLAGKRAKDMWAEDARRFGLTIESE